MWKAMICEMWCAQAIEGKTLRYSYEAKNTENQNDKITNRVTTIAVQHYIEKATMIMRQSFFFQMNDRQFFFATDYYASINVNEKACITTNSTYFANQFRKKVFYILFNLLIFEALDMIQEKKYCHNSSEIYSTAIENG